MDETLQAAMLSPETEFLPDLWATTLDEILAIGVGGLVVDHELGDLVSPVVATVAFDQAIDSCFELKQLRS